MAAKATSENGSSSSSPAMIKSSMVSPFSLRVIALVGWACHCAWKAKKCIALFCSAWRHSSRDNSPNASVQPSRSPTKSTRASMRAWIVCPMISIPADGEPGWPDRVCRRDLMGKPPQGFHCGVVREQQHTVIVHNSKSVRSAASGCISDSLREWGSPVPRSCAGPCLSTLSVGALAVCPPPIALQLSLSLPVPIPQQQYPVLSVLSSRV